MSKKRRASKAETAAMLVIVIGMAAVTFVVLGWIAIQAWNRYGWP